MKNFVEAVLAGLFVGVIVFVVCLLLGHNIKQLSDLGTYAGLIGLLAGLLVFAKKWDWAIFKGNV